MRSLWFLPLTFVAGVHGFAIFAPYLAVVFAALHLRSRLRNRARPVPATVRHSADHLPPALAAALPA